MAVNRGELGDSALWEAVLAQSNTWAALPVVRDFAAELPRNNMDRPTALSGLLQNVMSSSSSAGKNPMRMGTEIQILLSLGEEVPGSLREPLDGWLDLARRVEVAHRSSVAWLRSRLPRYPFILAPQLAAGTPLTTSEYTNRLSWARGELGEGLQVQNPPTWALPALGASPADEVNVTRALKEVLSALRRAGPWERFCEVSDALTDSDISELKAIRRHVRQLLRRSAVDEYESNLAMDRLEFRYKIVSEVVNDLSGTVREYAGAFDAIDALIELACSNVFGQLCVYGATRIVGASNLAFNGLGLGSLEFEAEFMPSLDTGSVCWLGDELVTDAVYVTGLTLSFDQAVGMRTRARGRLLTGTEIGWRNGPVML